MDFAILPPEINSGRMYAGPGSGPMLAAAAVWDGLATELHAAGASYGSVISGLTAGPWLGRASAAMAAAAGPYVAWMRSTVAQAEQAATQAKAAAAAYEVAFAATVAPPVIAANRALLMALVASNIFGQNTPAIAATEAHYAEMWARCRGDVRLRGRVGVGDNADAVHPTTAEHQPWWAGRPSCRHIGRDQDTDGAVAANVGRAHGATGARLTLVLHIGGRAVHVRTPRNPAEPGPDIPFDHIRAREFGSRVV
jgi:hypothetical protein